MRVVRAFMVNNGEIDECVAIEADQGGWTVVNGTRGYVVGQNIRSFRDEAELPSGFFDNPTDAVKSALDRAKGDILEDILELEKKVAALKKQLTPFLL